MNTRHNEPSMADLGSEVGGIATGLGIVSMTFFPLVLPGLLLLLPVVVLGLPLLIVAGVGYGLVRMLRWVRGAMGRDHRLEAEPEQPSARIARRPQAATRT
jgi:hypothetical protein